VPWLVSGVAGLVVALAASSADGAGALVAGLVCAALLLAFSLHASYASAVALFPDAPVSVRLSAAAALAYAGLLAVFFSLGSVRLFRLWAVVPVCVALAAFAHAWAGRRASPRERLRDDLRTARELLAGLGPARWLALAALPVAFRVARGLVAPPLGWDALTYHLLKAGQWVQAGGFVAMTGPDANRGYDYLPPHGDVLWAWAMLPIRGDALVAPAGFLVWCSALLAAYACARSLGASQRRAFAAALAAALVPASASLVSAAYVDNLVLAALLLAALFGARAIEAPGWRDVLVAGVALGVLAGTKTTGAVVAAAGGLVLLAAMCRPYRIRSIVPGVIAASTLGVAPYLRPWIETGNPLYPFPVRIAGRLLFPGDETSVAMASAAAKVPAPTLRELLRYVSTPFADGQRFAGIPVEFDHMGLGPAFVVLLPLGLAGAFVLARAGRGRAVAMLLALAGALVLGQLLGGRHLWAPGYVSSVQRYVVGVTAVLAVLATAVAPRWTTLLVAASAVVSGLLSIPRGVGPAETRSLVEALPAFGLGAGGLVLAWIAVRRGRERSAAAIAGATGVLALALLLVVRDRARYEVYADAALQRAHDPHFLHPFAVRAWPLWQALDGAEPRRIAVAAGLDFTTTNWFRAPLLGSRLQNEVLYVPPTADGELVSYGDREGLRRRADRDAWLRALVAADADHFVALAPRPPEASWALAAPDLFEVVATSADGGSVAFRFHPDRARELLAAGAR
jgi:hypothetical protein